MMNCLWSRICLLLSLTLVARYDLFFAFSPRSPKDAPGEPMMVSPTLVKTQGEEMALDNKSNLSSNLKLAVEPANEVTASVDATSTMIVTVPLQNDTANTQFLQDHGLAPDTRLCRLDPSPKLGERPTDNNYNETNWKGMGLTWRFQCNGRRYREFMSEDLFPLVRKRQQHDHNWGRRPSIIPPSATATHKHVLVAGNSHTRQVILALLCQYREQVIASELLAPYSDSMQILSQAITLQAEDTTTVTLYILTNHPAVYSSLWKQNVERIVGRSLSEFDAIVMGLHNEYDSRQPTKAALWQSIREYSVLHPDQRVGYKKTRPFGLPELLQVYNKPVVHVSMFKEHQQERYQQNMAYVNSNNNVKGVDARAHIRQLDGKTCSSDSSGRVKDCTDSGNLMEYRNGHKCLGGMGGEPDIVAWDVVEVLWELLSISTA